MCLCFLFFLFRAREQNSDTLKDGPARGPRPKLNFQNGWRPKSIHFLMTFPYTNRFKMHFWAHVYFLQLRNSSLGLAPRVGESKKQCKRARKNKQWRFGWKQIFEKLHGPHQSCKNIKNLDVFETTSKWMIKTSQKNI